MTPLPNTLTLGSPRFSAGSAQGTDVSAAWRALLLEKGAAGATADVAGDFAVGLKQADGSAFMAVDRFSTQTLCYRVDGQELEFAARTL